MIGMGGQSGFGWDHQSKRVGLDFELAKTLLSRGLQHVTDSVVP